MENFKGKVALVTGAAAGIGRATALLFAKGGAQILVSDLDISGGEQTAQMIRKVDGEAEFIACDISQAEQVREMVQYCIKQFGRIDFACNNAGTEGESALTADCSEENWQKVIDINLKGTWLCMKYEIQEMLKRGKGSIVNVSSIAGLIAVNGVPAYVASKHGMNGLTKAAALEYASSNIRINSVCPGAIKTEMLERFTKGDSAALNDLVSKHPLGRMGTPEEIAELIVWLSSDKSSFITGQTIAADGGYVAQ
jgi:NAD(P)-dependent dehydrogenase (short-subunit alcohol dehydrogenase family)